jgi:hypothetical protein
MRNYNYYITKNGDPAVLGIREFHNTTLAHLRLNLILFELEFFFLFIYECHGMCTLNHGASIIWTF